MGNLANRKLNVPLALIALVTLGVALMAMKAILMPLAVAFFLACLSGPSIQWMKKRGIPASVTILVILLVVGGMVFLMGKVFASQFPVLESKAPGYWERLQILAYQVVIDWVPDKARSILDVDHWIEAVPVRTLMQTAARQLGNLFGIIGTSLLILLYLVFLLLEREQLAERIRRCWTQEEGQRIFDIIENIQKQTESYLVGKALVSLTTGSLATLVLWIFGVEFFFLWGLLTFLLNFVPNIGSIIATVIPLLVALVQPDATAVTTVTLEDGTVKEVAAAAFSLVQVGVLGLLLTLIQVSIGSLLEPRLLGHRLSLSPFMVFFSFVFWGWLWGLPGMILSVPIMATIRIVMENVDALKPLAVLVGQPSRAKES